MMLLLGLLKYYEEVRNLVIEKCKCMNQLVAHGMLTHRYFIEVFLLERNINRNMLGGSRFLAVHGVLTCGSFLEAFLLETNMSREMLGVYRFLIVHGMLIQSSFLEVFLLEREE